MSAPKHRYYFAGLALAALAIFLAPVPFEYFNSFKDSGLRRTLKGGSDTVMFGASTIDGKSACDTDRRSIVDMTTAALGKNVINGSYSGQGIEDSVQFAALAAKAPGIKTIVLTSSWGGLGEDRLLPLHGYVTFRELNPELKVDGPLRYFERIQDLKGAARKVDQPFEFRGENYPGLAGFDKALFTAEAAARTCPEHDGHNEKAIAAIYYQRLMVQEPAPANLALITSLNDKMVRQGKSLIFVLMPVNVERLARIDSRWPDAFRERRAKFASKLRERGVPVVDISEQLPNDLFIDRWCGCSHYSAEGRRQVALEIARALKEPAQQIASLPGERRPRS